MKQGKIHLTRALGNRARAKNKRGRLGGVQPRNTVKPRPGADRPGPRGQLGHRTRPASWRDPLKSALSNTRTGKGEGSRNKKRWDQKVKPGGKEHGKSGSQKKNRTPRDVLGGQRDFSKPRAKRWTSKRWKKSPEKKKKTGPAGTDGGGTANSPDRHRKMRRQAGRVPGRRPGALVVTTRKNQGGGKTRPQKKWTLVGEQEESGPGGTPVAIEKSHS